MAYLSVTSPEFQEACKQWLNELGEVLVLFRYSHAAGSKDYEFFTDISLLNDRISRLPAKTCITVWGDPLLQIRGRVDETLIATAFSQIPEYTEWLLVGLDQVDYVKYSNFPHTAGETLSELSKALNDSKGEPIALGLYPAWSENGGKEVSALVLEANGALTIGRY